MPKKSKGGKKAAAPTPDPAAIEELDVEETEAASPKKSKKDAKKDAKKAKKRQKKQKRAGGGADDDPPPPPADGDDGYESPDSVDIADGLDELEEMDLHDEGSDTPQTPGALDALDDLEALEIPDDDDDDGGGGGVDHSNVARGGGIAGAIGKQDKKAAEKLAKQEAKQEAERERQLAKQEAKAAAKLAKQEAKAAAKLAVEEEAAAAATAADEAAIAALREEHGVKEGHPVEYQSTTSNDWLPAKLVEITADGALYLDLGDGRANEQFDPQRVRPALYRAKPKVLEAHIKAVKRNVKLQSHAGAAVAAAEAERLLAAKSLLLRSCHNGDLRSMRSALRDGAHVNCRDTNRWTPLMCAARYGDARCVRALLAEGADIDSSSRGGATALHMAASNGRADVILLLLKAGADLNAQTDSGMRPRQLAERRGMLEAVATIDVFQPGGGLEQITAGSSSLAQREALRETVVQSKVRRRDIVAHGDSIKKQKGREMLEQFRNQIGPLQRQGKAQKEWLATRGEAHAEQVEARWYMEHIADPRGVQAGVEYLDLLHVHRLPEDKLLTASRNVALLRKLFDSLDMRRQGWLPRHLAYEFLQTLDPEWTPPGGRGRDYSKDQEANWITSFDTLLKLFIGTSTSNMAAISVGAVEGMLLGDYSESAGLVADIAAIIKIGQAKHGRSLIDFGEFVGTLMPAIIGHTKKSHQMKPKEYLEVWRSLVKIPDDDPRISNFKHGGPSVSGRSLDESTEPGHIDVATLLASVRADGDGLRSTQNAKLYRKFFNCVLSPSTLALDELVNSLTAEQDKITEGVWLRANRPVVVRAEARVDSKEVAILVPGETVQVLSTVLVHGTTMLRIQCIRGWVSHTSAMDGDIVLDRMGDDDENRLDIPINDPPTTDEEADEFEPSTVELNQTRGLDGNDDAGPSADSDRIELLVGMLCMASRPLNARRSAGPKSKKVAGGSVPRGQAFHILAISQRFADYVLCYCGWVQILTDGKSPAVRFLDDTGDASQVFVIGGAGRIADVGPLGITFIESPNPHWMPGSNEPKFCTAMHSVGRGSPAAKACPEMARGACYGWILEQVESISVTRMSFENVLSTIQKTTQRPMSLRLRPSSFISVPLKPILNDDGTDIAVADEATEGQDEKGMGGYFFNSLMHGFYRTVHETTLRAGCNVGTRIAGVLSPGAFVEVIESRVNSMGHTRLLCICLGLEDSDEGKGTQGWASLYARDGRRLLREQTEQEIRDRDKLEHNTFQLEERMFERERTKKANEREARKMAGQNPLEVRMFTAAASGDAGWTVEQLEQGAQINSLDAEGCTPIMRAAENGHDDVVKALWQYGVSRRVEVLLNEMGDAGTALGLATANGHINVVATLLRNNADPLAADDQGVRPLDIARRLQNDHLVMMLEEATNIAKKNVHRARLKESVKMAAMHTFAPHLLRQIADACDDLHSAVSSSNIPRTTDAIRALHGLDSANAINRPDHTGYLPLTKAAAAGHCAIVSILLAHNATVDGRDERGHTALAIACKFGQAGATGLLLRAGADPELALDSLSNLAKTVGLINPLANGLVDDRVSMDVGAKSVARKVDKEKAGLAGCQLLLRQAYVARNIVKTNQQAGKTPVGIPPLDLSQWSGGNFAGTSGMRIKLNGVRGPTISEAAELADSSTYLNAEAAAVNDYAGGSGSADAEQQAPPPAKSKPKKRSLFRSVGGGGPSSQDAAADTNNGADPDVLAADAPEVSEQTENPLSSSSYSNGGPASPISDGNATFDMEDEGERRGKSKSKSKWKGGLKRRKATPAAEQVPGDLVETTESPLDATGGGGGGGVSAVGGSTPNDADELSAIEIPNDEGEGEDEQVGDLL
jgi:ankyrin repeat protein